MPASSNACTCAGVRSARAGGSGSGITGVCGPPVGDEEGGALVGVAVGSDGVGVPVGVGVPDDVGFVGFGIGLALTVAVGLCVGGSVGVGDGLVVGCGCEVRA